MFFRCLLSLLVLKKLHSHQNKNIEMTNNFIFGLKLTSDILNQNLTVVASHINLSQKINSLLLYLTLMTILWWSCWVKHKNNFKQYLKYCHFKNFVFSSFICKYKLRQQQTRKEDMTSELPTQWRRAKEWNALKI